MKRLIYILLILIAFTGCRSKKPPIVHVPVETKIIIKERLVPVALPADSSTLTALFECDSLNQVQMKEIGELKTKDVQSQFNFSAKTGAFSYETKRILDTVYIPGKDSIIYQDKPFPVEVETIVYEQTAVQKFLTIVGGIALILVVIGVIIKFK